MILLYPFSQLIQICSDKKKLEYIDNIEYCLFYTIIEMKTLYNIIPILF